MKNRIIITANPSFAVENESDFWRQFDAICEQEGWRLFKHSMRKIPADESTMILPARLNDVAGYIKNFPMGGSGESLPEWLSSENFEKIVDWEVRRWQLPNRVSGIDLGLTKLAWHVDHLFRCLNPAGVIVSNKIDHGTALFYWASKHYGATRIFFERSPLMTFIIERQGMFYESEIWSRFSEEVDQNRDLYRHIGWKLAGDLTKNPEGFRKQEFQDACSEIRELHEFKGPKLFLPMDNTLWTGWAQKGHWQGCIDYYPGTPMPSSAIDEVARIVAQYDGLLVVKRHPSDVQTYDCSQKNVRFVDAPINNLIHVCDATVCFLTKLAFVAAAFEKPTVTLAPNTAAASGATFHAERTADWSQAIRAALAATTTEIKDRTARFHDLLGWLDRRFYLDATLPSDHGKPGARTLFTRIAASAPGSHAGGSLTAIDQRIARVRAQYEDRKNWPTVPASKVDSVTIIYDVSRLANTRLQHSGISRFAWKMLEHVSDEDGVDVIPALLRPEVLMRGEFANNLTGFGEFLGRKVYSPEDIPALVEGKRAVYFSPYDPLYRIKDWNGPRIATVHDVLHLTRSDLYLSAKAKWHINSVLTSIAPGDSVLAVSEFTRMQLLRVTGLPPESVTTVHLGANTVYSPANEMDVRAFRDRAGLGDASYFVLFAQFEARKNVPTSLSALRAVLDHQETNARFVIACAKLGGSQVRQAVDRVGIREDQVAIVEGPTDEEMATIYSGARGVLYVSLGEGFGLPVLEAMRCGCPAITSSVTSIPEVAGDSALYVDPYSVSQIADAILSLERSDALQTQLRNRALARGQQYTWERAAHEFLSVVRDCQADWSAKRLELGYARGERGTEEGASDILGWMSDWTDPNEARRLLVMVTSHLLLEPRASFARLTTCRALGRAVERAVDELPRADDVRVHFLRVRRHLEGQGASAQACESADFSGHPDETVQASRRGSL